MPLKASSSVVDLPELEGIELVAPAQGTEGQLCALTPEMPSPSLFLASLHHYQPWQAGAGQLMMKQWLPQPFLWGLLPFSGLFLRCCSISHNWCAAIVHPAPRCLKPEFVWWVEGGVGRMKDEYGCVMELTWILSSVIWLLPLFSFSISTVENSFEER